jgi:hypothetical protein
MVLHRTLGILLVLATFCAAGCGNTDAEKKLKESQEAVKKLEELEKRKSTIVAEEAKKIVKQMAELDEDSRKLVGFWEYHCSEPRLKGKYIFIPNGKFKFLGTFNESSLSHDGTWRLVGGQLHMAITKQAVMDKNLNLIGLVTLYEVIEFTESELKLRDKDTLKIDSMTRVKKKD